MSGVVDTLAEIWRKLGRVKGREGNGAVKYKIHSDICNQTQDDILIQIVQGPREQ